jgi:hypothetical protein
MRLLQTLSEALARTRDAQQFQVQTEVALLTACDVEGVAPPPVSARATEAPEIAAAPHITAPASAVATPPGPVAPLAIARVASAPSPTAADSVLPRVDPGSGPPAEVPAPVLETTLETRWPDVIEQVRNRNPILASLLGSAHPVAVQDSVLIVAFGTDFNRKSAESKNHRQLIERAFERVYGTAYRLRCTVRAEPDGGTNLLDDPVINYAARTFGGQPKRVATEET